MSMDLFCLNETLMRRILSVAMSQGGDFADTRVRKESVSFGSIRGPEWLDGLAFGTRRPTEISKDVVPDTLSTSLCPIIYVTATTYHYLHRIDRYKYCTVGRYCTVYTVRVQYK